MNKSNTKPVKAEITVVFKTCDLIDTYEFENKYQGDIKKLVQDILKKYSLFEIVDKENKILKITLSSDY